MAYKCISVLGMSWMLACGADQTGDTSAATTTTSTTTGGGSTAQGSGGAGGKSATASTSAASGGSGGTAGTGGAAATGGGGTGGTTGSGGNAGSGGASTGLSCTWSANGNPCAKGFYCAAPGCGSGTCQPLNTVSDGVKAPVCGCDGVNYWNAATASLYGMAVKQVGACKMAKTCGGFQGLQCPSQDPAIKFPYTESHYCARLAMSAQECKVADLPAPCWGLPPSCAVIGFGGKFNSCPPSGKTCQYECDAIKQGGSYYEDTTCPQ